MNNENNNDIYQEDNGFNNQGIVDSPDTTEPVEQQTQLPRAGRGGSNFGNIAQGLPGQLKNKENNPGLGLPKHKNDPKQQNNQNNPATGQNQSKDNKNGLENNKNNQNKNTPQKSPGTNQQSNNKSPLPGTVPNKNSNNKEKQQEQKKKDNKNKKPLSAMNPFARRKEMLKSKFGIGKNKESGKGVTAPNLNEIGEKGILKKILKIPMPAKIILPIIILLSLLFLILLSALFASLHSSLNGSSGYCGGDSYDLSVLDDPKPSYTYTGAFAVKWSKSSAQYKTLTEASTYADEDGFLRSGDAYFIALGSYFGIEQDGKKKLVMGTKYLIKLKNGTEFVGILGDAKADQHTTESSKHAQHITDKSVVEFEMACGSKIVPKDYGFNFSGNYKTSCDGMQQNINKKFSGEIESISLNDDSGASCTQMSGLSGGGAFPIRTQWFTSSDRERIFAKCKGCKAQWNFSNTTCVTYAKLRAAEIIMTATNVDDNYKNKAINTISNTHGNGGWWSGTNNQNLRKFNYDSTCNYPKAGSLISWAGNGARCGGGYCGHVGIIEAVNGNNVTITDGYKGSPFNTHNWTISQMKQKYGGCRGITYLFEYKG